MTDYHKVTGFTLIETLLVISILGIFMTGTVVSLVGFQRRIILKTNVDEIGSIIREVRTRSIAAMNGQSYGLCFNTDSYYIFTSGSNDVESYNISGGVQINNVNFDNDGCIEFGKVTGLPSQSGFFEIGIADTTYTISINAEGTIDVTEGVLDIEIPTAFNLLSPASGAVNTETLLPAFNWGDSIGTDVNYYLWHSIDSNFSSGVRVDAGYSSEVTLHTGKELEGNARNYWRVEAVNSQGFSRWANQRDWFIDSAVIGVDFPSIFNLLLPEDEATINSRTPTFDWEDSSDATEEVTYTLIIDDDSDFSSPAVYKSALSVSEYTIQSNEKLSWNTTYYWQVIATDGVHDTQCTQVDWEFVIEK